MRILYIEDEKFLADAVKFNLEKSGMTVDIERDGGTGLESALKDIYDCIVLDLMLPKISGSEIIQILRHKNIHTPIIVLSALSQTDDKIHHLDLGADDYLAKPFKTAELLARIKAIERRPRALRPQKLNYQDLEYDLLNKTLNGNELTAKESAIFEELIKTPEKIVAKDFLLHKIWQDSSVAADNYVEVYISRLRHKIKLAKSKSIIRAHRGFGYKLCS